jgi:hypothetical protein
MKQIKLIYTTSKDEKLMDFDQFAASIQHDPAFKDLATFTLKYSDGGDWVDVSSDKKIIHQLNDQLLKLTQGNQSQKRLVDINQDNDSQKRLVNIKTSKMRSVTEWEIHLIPRHCQGDNYYYPNPSYIWQKQKEGEYKYEWRVGGELLTWSRFIAINDVTENQPSPFSEPPDPLIRDLVIKAQKIHDNDIFDMALYFLQLKNVQSVVLDMPLNTKESNMLRTAIEGSEAAKAKLFTFCFAHSAKENGSAEHIDNLKQEGASCVPKLI